MRFQNVSFGSEGGMSGRGLESGKLFFEARIVFLF
jgi:hypothetical protein